MTTLALALLLSLAIDAAHAFINPSPAALRNAAAAPTITRRRAAAVVMKAERVRLEEEKNVDLLSCID